MKLAFPQIGRIGRGERHRRHLSVHDKNKNTMRICSTERRSSEPANERKCSESLKRRKPSFTRSSLARFWASTKAKSSGNLRTCRKKKKQSRNAQPTNLDAIFCTKNTLRTTSPPVSETEHPRKKVSQDSNYSTGRVLAEIRLFPFTHSVR